MKREIRLQPLPARLVLGEWEFEDRQIVRVDSDAWIIVRRADSPQAMPYVISRKDWDRFSVLSPEAEG